jgi:hypothetical protein
MWPQLRQTLRNLASPPRLNATEGFMSKNKSRSFREYVSALRKEIPFDEHKARQEIEARNNLRRGSHLPILNIDHELRKMHSVAEREHFERFRRANWERAEKVALKDWKPESPFARWGLIQGVILRWYDADR